MFDYQECSIFDPDLFKPKPKKKPIQQQPIQKVNWKPIVRNIKRAKQNTVGLIQTFQTIRSPEYQLKKAKRQIKEIETRKELNKVRAQLNEEKRKINESKANERRIALDELKRKIGIKSKPGFERMKY